MITFEEFFEIIEFFHLFAIILNYLTKIRSITSHRRHFSIFELINESLANDFVVTWYMKQILII